MCLVSYSESSKIAFINRIGEKIHALKTSRSNSAGHITSIFPYMAFSIYNSACILSYGSGFSIGCRNERFEMSDNGYDRDSILRYFLKPDTIHKNKFLQFYGYIGKALTLVTEKNIKIITTLG